MPQTNTAPHPDTVLRMACAAYLTFPDGSLAPAEADWLRTRLQSQEAFTPHERQTIKAPLLSWCVRRGIEAKVAVQFGEEVSHETDTSFPSQDQGIPR